MSRKTIEIVCESMLCFKVDATTLEPLGSSYYEPAATSDPRGEQMSHGEWCRRRNERRTSSVGNGARDGGGVDHD